MLAAWRNTFSQHEFNDPFNSPASSYSDSMSFTVDLLAYDLITDMAYTATFEHTSASVDGKPRTQTYAEKPTNGRSRITTATPSPKQTDLTARSTARKDCPNPNPHPHTARLLGRGRAVRLASSARQFRMFRGWPRQCRAVSVASLSG